MRINTYAFPHKALRNLLGQVSLAAGKADANHPESVFTLKQLFSRLLDFLKEHARIEEEIYLPSLEERMPGSTKENHEEHEYLERKINHLASRMDFLGQESTRIEFNEFYLDFSEFHAEYLQHMLLEEREVLKNVWKSFTDEELLAQHHRILASFTPERVLKSYRYIIPSLTVTERALPLSGLKAKATEGFFQEVLGEIREELKEKDYLFLQENLNPVLEK